MKPSGKERAGGAQVGHDSGEPVRPRGWCVRPRSGCRTTNRHRKKGATEIVTWLKMEQRVVDLTDVDKRLQERQEKMDEFYKSQSEEGGK